MPRLPHGAGQRAGAGRRHVRTQRRRGRQARSRAVVLPDHGLRPGAARRPRRAGVARPGEDHAAQLDRPQRRRPVPDAGRRDRARDRGVHHPARHRLRHDLRRAGPRAPAGDGDHDPGALRRRRAVRRPGPAHERHRPDVERGRPRQAGRVHRCLCREPLHRGSGADLPGRLRAGHLRHRGDHGRAGAGPARLGLRPGPRPPDRPHGAAARGLGGRGLHRGRPGCEQPMARRARRGRGQGQGHRLARGARDRGAQDQLPAPGLAGQPAALLGQSDPDRLLPDARCRPRARGPAADRGPRRRRVPPDRRVAAAVPRGLPQHDLPRVRRSRRARDRHHGHVRGLVVVLPALLRPGQQAAAVLGSTPPSGGCRSTSTSGGSSTPSST